MHVSRTADGDLVYSAPATIVQNEIWNFLFSLLIGTYHKVIFSFAGCFFNFKS